MGEGNVFTGVSLFTWGGGRWRYRGGVVWGVYPDGGVCPGGVWQTPPRPLNTQTPLPRSVRILLEYILVSEVLAIAQ